MIEVYEFMSPQLSVCLSEGLDIPEFPTVIRYELDVDESEMQGVADAWSAYKLFKYDELAEGVRG